MKIRWAETAVEAAHLMQEYDAVLVKASKGKGVLVLFNNEDTLAQARKGLTNQQAGNYEGYPTLLCRTPNLVGRLKKVQLKQETPSSSPPPSQTVSQEKRRRQPRFMPPPPTNQPKTNE